MQSELLAIKTNSIKSPQDLLSLSIAPGFILHRDKDFIHVNTD